MTKIGIWLITMIISFALIAGLNFWFEFCIGLDLSVVMKLTLALGVPMSLVVGTAFAITNKI